MCLEILRCTELYPLKKEISTQLLTADINIKKQLLFMVTIVAEYDGSRGAYPVIEHKCLMGFL